MQCEASAGKMMPRNPSPFRLRPVPVPHAQQHGAEAPRCHLLSPRASLWSAGGVADGSAEVSPGICVSRTGARSCVTVWHAFSFPRTTVEFYHVTTVLVLGVGYVNVRRLAAERAPAPWTVASCRTAPKLPVTDSRRRTPAPRIEPRSDVRLERQLLRGKAGYRATVLSNEASRSWHCLLGHEAAEPTA